MVSGEEKQGMVEVGGIPEAWRGPGVGGGLQEEVRPTSLSPSTPLGSPRIS